MITAEQQAEQVLLSLGAQIKWQQTALDQWRGISDTEFQYAIERAYSEGKPFYRAHILGVEHTCFDSLDEAKAGCERMEMASTWH